MSIRVSPDSVLLEFKHCIHILDKRNGHSTQIKPTAMEPMPQVNQNGRSNKEEGDGCFITVSHLAECGSLCLVGTSDKRITVYKKNISTTDWDVVAVKSCAKRSIKLSLTASEPRKILSADRTGDVYEFTLGSDTKPALLMGRLSMLLDMVLTEDDRHLIVSDRDEKIQVSKYPDCFDIISFCLGHKEFVTSLVCLKKYENTLASVSGDGCLHVWNYISGELLHILNCWNEAEKEECLSPFSRFFIDDAGKPKPPPLKKVIGHEQFICAIYSQVPVIHVFIYDGSELKFSGNILLESEPWDVVFEDDGHLIVLHPPHISVYRLGLSGNHEKMNLNSAWLNGESLRKVISEYSEGDSPASDITALYKQHFDNIDEYHEKKRKRVENRVRRE